MTSCIDGNSESKISSGGTVIGGTGTLIVVIGSLIAVVGSVIAVAGRRGQTAENSSYASELLLWPPRRTSPLAGEPLQRSAQRSVVPARASLLSAEAARRRHILFNYRHLDRGYRQGSRKQRSTQFGERDGDRCHRFARCERRHNDR